jgi:RimJ/RimL family protein N-acetyltransferase
MKDINYDNYFWQEDGIRLRAMKVEDAENQYYNRFDTVGRRFLNYEVELPLGKEALKKSFEGFCDFDPGTCLYMFIIETLEGIAVGSLNLCGVDHKNGKFGIGIEVNIDHRGNGYGTKAMRILLKYGFFELGLNKFNTCVFEGNIACATMMEKLGCKHEGIHRQIVYTNGKYWDEIFFGLTKDEFIENEKNINL